MRIRKNAKPLTGLGMLVIVAVVYALDHWKRSKESAEPKKPSTP